MNHYNQCQCLKHRTVREILLNNKAMRIFQRFVLLLIITRVSLEMTLMGMKKMTVGIYLEMKMKTRMKRMRTMVDRLRNQIMCLRVVSGKTIIIETGDEP